MCPGRQDRPPAPPTGHPAPLCCPPPAPQFQQLRLASDPFPEEQTQGSVASGRTNRGRMEEGKGCGIAGLDPRGTALHLNSSASAWVDEHRQPRPMGRARRHVPIPALTPPLPVPHSLGAGFQAQMQPPNPPATPPHPSSETALPEPPSPEWWKREKVPGSLCGWDPGPTWATPGQPCKPALPRPHSPFPSAPACTASLDLITEFFAHGRASTVKPCYK